MNNQIIPTNEKKTMTSREIADLVELRHDNVKRTIDNLVLAALIYRPQIEDGIKSANGITEKVYVICQRDTYVIVAQLSPQFTARLVDRWQELERQVLAPVFSIPTSLSSALRLAAEQAETIEAQALQITAATPAIEFVAKHAATDGLSTFRQVAKLIGANEVDLRAFLVEVKAMYRLNEQWAPYASQIDSGRMVVKVVEDAKGKPRNQSLFTSKGVQWVAGAFAQFGLKAITPALSPAMQALNLARMGGR